MNCPHCQTPIIRKPTERDDQYARRQTCGQILCVTKQRKITLQANAKSRGYNTNAPTDREDWWHTQAPDFPPWDKPFSKHNIKPPKHRIFLRNHLPQQTHTHTKSGIADL